MRISFPKCFMCGISDVRECKICDMFACNDCTKYVTDSLTGEVRCEHTKYISKQYNNWSPNA